MLRINEWKGVELGIKRCTVPCVKINCTDLINLRSCRVTLESTIVIKSYLASYLVSSNEREGRKSIDNNISGVPLWPIFCMLQWLQDIVIVAFDLDNGQNAARNIIRDISPLFNDVGRIHKFSYPREPSTILISDPKTIENFIPPIKNNKITALKNDTSFHALCFSCAAILQFSIYIDYGKFHSKLYLLEIFNEFYNIPEI